MIVLHVSFTETEMEKHSATTNGTSAENSSMSMLSNISMSFNSNHLATTSGRTPKHLNAFYEEKTKYDEVMAVSYINGPWSSLNVRMQMWQMNLVQAL